MIDDGLLLLAGIVHGLFVSGGPLLIAYASKKLTDKNQFRATISSVWVVLNTIILVDDIRFGYWDLQLFRKLLVSIPFFLCGIGVGSVLSKKLSKNVFLILTYLLMAFSGVMLLLK